MEIPEICTEQEKQILAFIHSRLKLFEPVSVIGLKGLGKNVIFNNIDTSFLVRRGYTIFKIITRNETELDAFIAKITKVKSPLVALLSFSLDNDGSKYLKSLSTLREKRSTKFVPVLLSDIKSVFSAYQSKDRTITRSLTYLKPLNLSDTQALVLSISKRVGVKLSSEDINKIYKLTGGHLGLIKSLILMHKDNGFFPAANSFYSNPSVVTRLQEIKGDLPENIVKKISTESHFSESELDFLNNFGLIKSGKFAISTFSNFLETNIKGLEVNLDSFTKNEIALFNLFQSSISKVVDREEIAKTIWKDNWEERYSEWAIDQNVSRLREKLRKSRSSFEIVAKKGLGYMLQEK